MNDKESCKYNINAWNKEINMFHDLISSLDNITLKQIDIRRSDRNKNDHDAVNKNTYYLLLYNGKWLISKALERYHGGWEFDVGSYLTGLGSLDGLFETNLEQYPKQLIHRIPLEQKDEDSDYDEE